jgi:hypothetical protein
MSTYNSAFKMTSMFQTASAYYAVVRNGEFARITKMPVRPGKTNGWPQSTLVTSTKLNDWLAKQEVI